MMRRLRPALLKVHRWLGITVGLLLILNALTGSMMLAARPLDRAINHVLFRVPVPANAQPVPLENLRQALLAEFGPRTGLTMRPGYEPQDSTLVFVRTESWQGQVYFDPYTGRRLGLREDHEGFANALFEFHSSLLSGETGKKVLAFNALTMLAMLVTGVIIWWPARWRTAFAVTLKGGLLRSLFDLHRVGGVVFGLWVMVCVATGTMMAWRPISQWATQEAGQQPRVPPVFTPVATGRPATVDEMVASVNAAMPGGTVRSIGMPARPTAPVNIRKKLDDELHPVGLSSVWLHPRTGEVLRVDPWNTLDIGARSYEWIYPLHAGKLGGVLSVLATAAGGLLLFGFGVSGTWLWWLRRKMRLSRPPKKLKLPRSPK